MNDILQWLEMYKEAIEAIAAIATVVSIVILVWDRMAQKPHFEMSRLTSESVADLKTGGPYFRIENRGREEAPGAYVECSIRRLRDGIRTVFFHRGKKIRLEQMIPALDVAAQTYHWVPEYDLKAGGYTVVSLIPDYFGEAKYLDGFLIFDIYAVKTSGRFVFLFRRRNESIRTWSGVLVDLLYPVCRCMWLLLGIKTNLVKIMRRLIRARE